MRRLQERGIGEVMYVIEYKFPVNDEEEERKMKVAIFENGEVVLSFLKRKRLGFEPVNGVFRLSLPEFYSFLTKVLKKLQPIMEKFKKRELGEIGKVDLNIRDRIQIDYWGDWEELSYPVPVKVYCGNCGENFVVPVYSIDQFNNLRCPRCDSFADPIEDFESFKKIHHFLSEREEKFREFLKLERLRKKLGVDPKTLEGFKKQMKILWEKIDDTYYKWKEIEDEFRSVELIQKYVFGVKDEENKESD